MIKTTLPARKAVSEIVRRYRRMLQRRDKPLPLRAFASALSDVVAPFGGGISHQTVKNWEDGLHLPEGFFMMQVAHHAPEDWRRDFAQDILAALRPDIYKPATVLAEQAIENSLRPASRKGGNPHLRAS
jgi:hypothetical protein